MNYQKCLNFFFSFILLIVFSVPILPTEVEKFSDLTDSYRVHLLETLGLRYILDIPVKTDGIKIAVIDSGIDYNHPYLKNKIVNGYD